MSQQLAMGEVTGSQEHVTSQAERMTPACCEHLLHASLTQADLSRRALHTPAHLQHRGGQSSRKAGHYKQAAPPIRAPTGQLRTAGRHTALVCGAGGKLSQD